MGDCSETFISSEEHCGIHCYIWKILVTSSLLSLLGSSKSKQSPQFDPAKQAYTGKVWAYHERRDRNVGDHVYPARDSLGGHMTFPASAECSLTAAQMQLPITSACFVLLFLLIQEELPWSSSDSLVVSHLFIHCSHLCLCTSQA